MPEPGRSRPAQARLADESIGALGLLGSVLGPTTVAALLFLI